MRRTLPLFAVLVACGLGVGYGTSAATGMTAPTGPTEHLVTTDEPVEPTGRAYPVQPATAAPSTPAPSPTATATEPARPGRSLPSPSATVAEAPAPAAVNPQPVPVGEPEPLDPEHPELAEQSPEERIGGARCPDPLEVVIAIAADGSLVCGVA